jgi:glycosyltransferase involved in cell wall biosynthesis
MQPLVSILIPAYNSERWLKETIESAINQVWNRKEIIVVDDGSRDTTFKIAKTFESNMVKVITQQNSGACVARNNALSVAQGDYIQWLDADDLLAPEKISKQVQQINEENNENILYSSGFGTFYYRYQKAKFIPHSLWYSLQPVEWFMRKFYNDDSMFPAVWLVSRKLTDQVGGWDERLTLDDDGEYFSRIVAKCESIKFVPEAISFYRQANLQSISKTINHKTCESLLLSYKLSIGYFLALENSERTRSCALKHLQANLIYFYPEEKKIVQELLEFAESLGGNLSKPEFSSKYSIFNKLFGLQVAKNLASMVRGSKQYVLSTSDQLMFHLGRYIGNL